MARYECSLCGYVYDEAVEGKAWERLGDNWSCPTCGSDKSEFAILETDDAQAPSMPAIAGDEEYLAA